MKKPVTIAQRVGVAIRRRREALDTNQDDFAASIHMHRTQYSAIERGERNLTLPTLDRVARGLGAKMWELLREAGL